MVTVKLIGGAGNQMFQYAFAKALAKAKNTDFRLDLTYLLDRTPRRDFTFRDYELNVFRIEPRFTFFSEIARSLPIPILYPLLSWFVTLVKRVLGIQKKVSEGKPGFRPEIFSVKGDIYLDGYWQSEKYFKSIAGEIREDFSFRTPLRGDIKNMADKIRSVNAVCIHVRRGDYITSPSASRVIGFVGKEYYQKAAQLIAERVRNPHFFIFSNDIGWCKKNIHTTFPAEFIGADYGDGKWHEHMRLMSLCKYFIIANSAFSWWAAWLGSYSGKIVIAPKKWFNDPSLDSKDVIPEGWIQL